MIKKFEDKMQKSIESLEREYNSIRAGRLVKSAILAKISS